MKKILLSWRQVFDMAFHAFSDDRLGQALGGALTVYNVFGIPRGGNILVHYLQSQPNFEHLNIVEDPWRANIIIDDILDSGKTATGYYTKYDKPVIPLCKITDFKEPDTWVIFPWEVGEEEKGPTESVVRLLEFIGEDINREGLIETPERFVAMLQEMTAGKHVDVAQLLGKTFSDGGDQLIVIKDIPFWSLCEHHIVPFYGTVSIGYIPKEGKVAGLSKFARLVEGLSHRLQMQERLTQQIGITIHNALNPIGVGVLVRGRHLCMEMRGVKTPAWTVTSWNTGAIRTQANGEFMALMNE